MSRDMEQNLEPIEEREQLVDFFRQGEKAPGDRGVGTEHEKFLYRRDDYAMVAYDEPGGIGEVFESLAANHGWQAGRDRGNIVALEKDKAAITLEPGGQLELSGAVHRDLYAAADEFDAHLELVKSEFGDRVAMVSWGLNPFFEPDEVPWMPKARYGIMKEYLPTRGDLAHWMMKTTCTIQANYDYTSEADAVDIIRTALHVSPIVSAIFANSPIGGREDTGYQSWRGYLWTRTDPDRTGWPAFMYGDDWGYADYVDYILDIPMFFIRRGGEYLDMSGTAFCDFFRDGHQGHQATMGDFELHLSTAFPEVRMKQFIEVRGADGGPREHVFALPALWKGLLYHQPSRTAALDLLAGMAPADHAELFMDVYRLGLQARVEAGAQGAQQVGELAGELLRLSRAGLDALAAADGTRSEAALLEPLEQIVADNRTSADLLRADWLQFDGDPAKIVPRWEL